MALRRLVSFSSASGVKDDAMMTSACGPGGHRIGHLGGDVAPDGHDAAEGALHVALERTLVRRDEVVGHGRAARVGVLDDGHGRLPRPASAASSWTSRQAASPSKRLRYDSGLPACWTMASHQLAVPAMR